MNTRFIKLSAFFTTITLLMACSSVDTITKLETGKSFSGNSSVAYDSSFQAIENFDYNYLREEGSSKYLFTADIFEMIGNNKYENAISMLKSELQSETDEELNGIYRTIFMELLFTQNKWNNILALQDTSEEAITYNAFAATYSKQPEEVIEFANDNFIPFETSISGTPIVEVTINGYKAYFFVDTGAGMTVVSSDVADECGLKPLSVENIEATAATTKTIGIDAALIESLKFGGVTVKNHPAIIIDSKHLKFKLLGIFTMLNIEGIIGWNVLQKLGMTIDYKTNHIEFYDGKSNPKNHTGNNMFWLGYPVIKLNGEDGSKLLFGLDTGAKTSSIQDKIIDRFGLNYSEEDIELGSAGGFANLPSKKVDSLRVFLSPDKSILFKNINTHPLEAATLIMLDGTIGSDLFKDSIVEIDFSNNYFDVR
ncbi:MAG: aspartyl protease family protein [bacterium]